MFFSLSLQKLRESHPWLMLSVNIFIKLSKAVSMLINLSINQVNHSKTCLYHILYGADSKTELGAQEISRCNKSPHRNTWRTEVSISRRKWEKSSHYDVGLVPMKERGKEDRWGVNVLTSENEVNGDLWAKIPYWRVWYWEEIALLSSNSITFTHWLKVMASDMCYSGFKDKA